ncbi:haloacid dehalogenase-like hydrolase [Chloropicon primus]|uniref:Haloacid dehalogenase-like hydrolase n=2 Tax=Chloropicon primus TaxID=1764295 RepID=A0A5B8MGL9_9CHLO|nr:haloacid dehalogenase-like hydrolase [Chloropicon primus]UPQ97701.1 haloacid dehalogenase-like hydrolase [Chloropicon primus]|eukprot:QDZ18492.1 haloacid dehalogenase-like hydrolase [Chloropicon primus]
MSETAKVKAVFLDMDDTLVLTSACDELAFVEVGNLATELVPGVDVDGLIAGFRKGMKATPWDVEYKIHVDEWRAGLWHAAIVEQNLEAGDGDLMGAARQLQTKYRDVRLSHFKFLEGVEGMIGRMKGKGLQTVIITNGHHEVQRQKLVACDAERLFGKDILVGGEEVLKGEQEKPHPSIFAKACKLAGCTFEEAVHVGDSLKSDIQGGINAKLAATIWINAPGKELPPNSPKPTYTVAKVTEIEEIVNKFV